ncbi:MAG: hypothetical protein A2Z18_11150 [Armatimonadetes bacterium RBG_16_58_9]|nr:MAG: hypothetical protein A2Z18_11150 [Armatimonadetes bacterium RBG_16_58_9]
MQLIKGNRPGPICRDCKKLHGRKQCPRRKRGRGLTPGQLLVREANEYFEMLLGNREVMKRARLVQAELLARRAV